MLRYDPGDFNKKIQIVSADYTEDEDGFSVLDDESQDTKILTTWAMVKTTRGMTIIMNNNADFEKAYTNFTIRFPKNFSIDRNYIVLFKNKRYRIDYVNNIDEEDVYLELQAVEVTK